MELKLRIEEVDHLYGLLKDFFYDIEDVYHFYAKRKKEKISLIKDIDELADDLFDDWEMDPNDMQFQVVQISPTLFMDYIQILSTMPVEPTQGRVFTLAVKEKTTDKYVGFIRLASPIISIKPRNEYIGRNVGGEGVNRWMINGSCIIPTQPFGFNCLGGKLLSLICASDIIPKIYKKKYGDICDVIFFETTSIYGSLNPVSQYDGLEPFIKWKGMTDSDIFLLPTNEIYDQITNMMKKYYGRPEYDGDFVPKDSTGVKLRKFTLAIQIISDHIKQFRPELIDEMKILKEKMKCSIKKRYYVSEYGYENVKEHIYSEGQIPLIKKKNHHNWNLDNMIKWWKKKAHNRWSNLQKDGRIKTELEFYTKRNYKKKD